jgi:ribosomal protein S18 acetylase RimI-like enzyme
VRRPWSVPRVNTRAEGSLEGVTIRAATLEDVRGVACVHVESWRSTYRGLLDDEFLRRMSIAGRVRQWTNAMGETGSHLLVAETSRAGIVGFASGGPERSGDPDHRAELYAIYLLADHQRSGLGSALTRALVERLLEDGHGSMLVWVLASNPARRFYEKLGGRELRTQEIRIGDHTYPEVAYGWRELATLRAMLG